MFDNEHDNDQLRTNRFDGKRMCSIEISSIRKLHSHPFIKAEMSPRAANNAPEMLVNSQEILSLLNGRTVIITYIHISNYYTMKSGNIEYIRSRSDTSKCSDVIP